MATMNPAPASVAMLKRLHTEAAGRPEQRDVEHAAFEAAARIADARDMYWAERHREGVKGRDIDDPVELATHWMQWAVIRAIGYGDVPQDERPRDKDRTRYEEEIARLDALVLAIVRNRRLGVEP